MRLPDELTPFAGHGNHVYARSASGGHFRIPIATQSLVPPSEDGDDNQPATDHGPGSTPPASVPRWRAWLTTPRGQRLARQAFDQGVN